MSECRYLKGENVAPKRKADVTALRGKRVQYLRGCDIDKSGRGYYFPRVGVVERSIGRDVVIDGDYVAFSSLVEMVVLT